MCNILFQLAKIINIAEKRFFFGLKMFALSAYSWSETKCLLC